MMGRILVGTLPSPPLPRRPILVDRVSAAAAATTSGATHRRVNSAVAIPFHGLLLFLGVEYQHLISIIPMTEEN